MSAQGQVKWGRIALFHTIVAGTWIRPADAADMLGVSMSTLRRWAHQRVISTRRVENPREQRYLKEELELILKISGSDRPTLWSLRCHIRERTKRGR